MTKNPHAVALGRKGGSVTSEAKKQATRRNLEKAREALAKLKTYPVKRSDGRIVNVTIPED